MDANVDDVPLLTGLQNGRDECPDTVDHTPEVDIDDAMPVLERKLPAEPSVHDARVVDGNVERTEALHDVPPRGVDGAGIAYVQLQAVDVCTIEAKGHCRLSDRVTVEIGHQDSRALGRELGRYGEANPTRCAGDDGDPSVQSIHVSMLLSLCENVVLRWRLP